MEDTRITNIRLMCLDPYKSIGYWNLIRIDTNHGTWGLGEAYWGPGLRPIIEELLKPLLIGENPLDVERLFTKMCWQTVGINGQNGVAMTAISGIEIALWDLAGKLTGLPVYRLLGGKYRDRVRLYRTGTPAHADDPAVCRDYAAQMAEEGWTAIKIIDADTLWERYDPGFEQHGHEPFARTMTLADLKLAEKIMANLRAAFGDEYDIAVHCHWALDLQDALRLAERVAPFQPMWLEDPLPTAFSPAWVQLTERAGVPICSGENLYGLREFGPFIAQHGLDIPHPDVPKAGGLAETRRIASLADHHAQKISMHYAASIVGLVASAHVAATLRNFGLLERAGESFPWYEDMVQHDKPLIQQGYLVLPDGPGLGVELNRDVVENLLAAGEEYWGD